MKKNWPTRPLQSLCDDFKQDIVDGPFGSDLQRKDYVTNGVPVLKIQNVKPFVIELKKMDYVSPEKFNELKRHSYRPGDIVLTKLGNPLGASAIVEDLDEGVIVADIVRIRAQRIDTKYLCYHLNSLKTNNFINSMQKGTTRPRVTLSVIRELPILVPPIREQQRIVGILDEAFDGIATAKANAEKNLQNARDLFESHLNSIFSQRGEGWQDVALAETCEIFADGDWIESKDQSPTGIRLIQTGNVGRGEFKNRIEQARYISEATFKRLRCTEIFEGDCLVSRLPDPVGRSCLLPNTGDRMITAVDCTILRFKKTHVIPSFFVYYSQSQDYLRAVNSETTGTTRNRISRNNLGHVAIPLAPIANQIRIVATLNPLLQEIKRFESIYQQKLETLEALKKSLLQQAFSGEL